MSWLMKPKGEIIETYGFIIQAIPSYVFQECVGSKLVIQTPYWFQYGSKSWYPVFISFQDTSENQELREWFTFCQSQQMKHKLSSLYDQISSTINPAPIYVKARKRGSNLYENDWKHKKNDELPVYSKWWIRDGFEQPEQIMWLFINRQCTINVLHKGIPNVHKELKKIYLDEKKRKASGIKITI